MLAILGLGLATVLSSTTPDMETIDLPLAGDPGQHVALHCLAPEHATTRAILFIHGASFPTLLAFGFEFSPGDSWITHTAKQGYLACGLDFLGFGASSRPPALSASPQAAPPVTQAPAAAQQIELAVEYLRREKGISRLHLVAHSWGTIPAAMFAAEFPSALASLTLFGPVVPVPGSTSKKTDVAWWDLSAQDRYEQLKFADVLPKGMDLLEPAVHARWASEFAASAPPESKMPDGNLRIPAGPLADLGAARAGVYPYAPDKITCPIFVVYGDYDTVVDDAGAAPFLAKFTASPLKWRLRIDHGTHVMHLERNRHALYESVDAFIGTVDGTGP